MCMLVPTEDTCMSLFTPEFISGVFLIHFLHSGHAKNFLNIYGRADTIFSVAASQEATEREEKMNNKAKKITTVAMLCAIAFVLVTVGRVPVVLFLSYDPKDIVITLGGLIWGPATSCLVSLIVSLIEMVTISDTGIIGCIMNFISTCSFACTAAFIYKKKHTLAGAVSGLLAGSALMVIVMLLWNYLITPIYMGYPREAVVELLPTAFLPFNLLKAGLNAGFTFILYKPIVTALRKAGLADTYAGNENKKSAWGLILIAVALIVTCILFILSMNEII